jgi:hypothetical protein
MTSESNRFSFRVQLTPMAMTLHKLLELQIFHLEIKNNNKAYLEIYKYEIRYHLYGPKTVLDT